MKTPCLEDKGQCPYPKPFADTHHKFYPRSEYRKGIAREFRELPENKEQLCRCAHDILHLIEEPPQKPTVEQMLKAIGGAALEAV